MTRLAIGVEYDGAAYSGWQRQHHADSVQGHLDKALGAIARHPIDTVAAGRTDAGVHACEQVVHFDTDANRPDRAWVKGVNTHLPDNIGVRWIAYPGDDFDARRSATSRVYRYLLIDSPERPVLLRDRVGWTFRALETVPMQQAAESLTGEHDFSSFRASACQAHHPIRRVDALTVMRYRGVIMVDIRANAFLHHMVRNIVGTLMAVGTGERPVEWVSDVLAARDRRRAGITAPAPGLYLVGVRYPLRFGLPGPPAGPVFAPAWGDG
ncbi:tRNA pseudouridine(38-40) synthase TruA [Spiribacter vilamensis]|uniref:tRNA pseudouridine synthase A n=1 Tax=Spiribacter vilamensis TaxID=531306 RepID=A0A4Q8CYF4_9GAMM|nr:tRNA pseudouridine(38-40) synthase TruA [Spiribacter vilamensis]RZU97984.1 tRNA pseudouridine38-40 synthase [Spiribacter vilamensis]TVO61103.1 tRNA pseudouridine(38-40) synthase TruA [Spiribacter vilamensis]